VEVEVEVEVMRVTVVTKLTVIFMIFPSSLCFITSVQTFTIPLFICFITMCFLCFTSSFHTCFLHMSYKCSPHDELMDILYLNSSIDCFCSLARL